MGSARLQEAMKVVGPVLVGQAVVSAGAGVSARLASRFGPDPSSVDSLVIWLLGGLAAVAINILFYQVMFLTQMKAASICLELTTSAVLLALVAFAGDAAFRVSPLHLSAMSALALLLAGLYALNWGWMVALERPICLMKRIFNIALCGPALYVLWHVWGLRQASLEDALRTALCGFTVVLLLYFVVGWTMVLRGEGAAQQRDEVDEAR